MSRIVARWPLSKTRSKKALGIVSDWKDDDSVRAYLATNFPYVAVIAIPKTDEAHSAAEKMFGPKHLQFFGWETYADKENILCHVVEHDGFEQFDECGDEIDPVKVVIQTSAKWAVYPFDDNYTHNNFYFADLNAATEFKLKFG